MVVKRGGGALEDRSDDDLMLLAAAGHRDAFAELARRYLPRLSDFCGKFVGDRAQGEELAQEVLLRVWIARGAYRGQGQFAVFVFTLARNAARKHLRDSGRRARWVTSAEAVGASEVASSRPDLLDELIAQENARRVRDGLSTLSEKLREVVLLRYDQGLEYGDIARIVRRPEVTVRSRVFHALRKLRQNVAGGVS